MWLQKLLKQSNYGTGSSPSGGAGSDGLASDNVLGLPGQGQLFQDDVPNREERYNAARRRKKRKMLERQRKWRSSRDQQSSQ